MEELKKYLSGYSWLFDVKEEKDYYVAYVHFMNLEVFEKVPDYFGNKKVLIYFAKSLTCNKKDFYEHVDLYSYVESNSLDESSDSVTVNLLN